MNFESDRLKVYVEGPGTWPKMKCSAVYVLRDKVGVLYFQAPLSALYAFVSLL